MLLGLSWVLGLGAVTLKLSHGLGSPVSCRVRLYTPNPKRTGDCTRLQRFGLGCVVPACSSPGTRWSQAPTMGPYIMLEDTVSYKYPQEQSW